MSQVNLSQADNGKSLELRAGDTLSLSLAENRLAGYEWAVRQGSEGVLVLEDDSYSPPSGGVVGGGGVRTLTFRASKPGVEHLQLELASLFPRDVPVAERYGVLVTVLT
jgi:inhibitor of cysteine peptidase